MREENKECRERDGEIKEEREGKEEETEEGNAGKEGRN